MSLVKNTDTMKPGYVYCLMMESHTYEDGIYYQFCTVGQARNTSRRFKWYNKTGPTEIKNIIGIRSTTLMDVAETRIMDEFAKQGYIRKTREWFLVKPGSDEQIKKLFMNIDIPTNQL